MSTNPDSSLPLRVATLLPADWAILEGLGIAPLRGEEFRLGYALDPRRRELRPLPMSLGVETLAR
jgi:hypothetical protein